MNNRQLPSVELLQAAPQAYPPHGQSPAGGRRLKVFFGVLLLALAIGLALVFARDPVYRASASVLTVKPKAVDSRSAEADVEHVVIQGRLLLGDELLGRLARRLGEEDPRAAVDPEALRGMLAVMPVPDTNLLELRAEGPDPAWLQRAVNRWAEDYEIFRAEEIAAATGRTTAELEDQQARLAERIEAARAELQAFRAAHEIVGLERGENRALAQLKGLNESLSKARDTVIAAQARKAAIDEAIARGETVVPSEQKAEIAKMQLEVQRARVRLSDLRQRYTDVYIERDPALKNLPDELRARENELAHALRLARLTVGDEAQQAVEAAELTLAGLERKLAEQQGAVQEFNERYREFKTLEENLARLEGLAADNAQRLAQIQVRNFERFPPIQVVEWARLPARPIHPDYQRDLLIAVVAAIALALFVTWLVEYLSGRPTPVAAPMVGVRVYPGESSAALEGSAPGPRLGRSEAYGLAAPQQDPLLPRELDAAEARAVLDAAEPDTAAYALLLLSGVSPYELPLLHAACLHPDAGLLEVPGASRRNIALAPNLWPRLQAVAEQLDADRMALPVAELDSRLRSAAARAGVSSPDDVDCLALWHSYVLHLVRQGAGPETLAARVGRMPAEVLERLAPFAPSAGARPAATIDFIHPALSA